MTERSAVPCAGCAACCRGELVSLHPGDGDVVELYEHDKMRVGPGDPMLVLKRKPNGDCLYLGEAGCTIWDHAPVMCRSFDCRRFYLRFNRAQRRRMKDAKEILAAGKQRLDSL